MEIITTFIYGIIAGALKEVLQNILDWVNTPTPYSKGQLTVSGSSEEVLTDYIIKYALSNGITLK